MSSSVRVVAPDEVTGSVTSGGFCGSQSTYTLHFVAAFDRSFASYGVFDDAGLHPGTAVCSGTEATACGGWVTFEALAERTVTMKVGVSYVSVHDAEGPSCPGGPRRPSASPSHRQRGGSSSRRRRARRPSPAASTLQVTATSTAPGAIHVAFDPRGEPADVPPVVLEVNPPSY